MQLSWRRSSGVEGRFEAWITKQHQQRVLAGETTPVGPCPDEAFLRDLARRSKHISLSDSRVDHAASCPTCMSRLLELRQKIHLRQRKLAFTAAIASCLVVAVALIAIARHRVLQQPPRANLAVISQTVNLWDAGTIRGEQPGQLQSVSMPAALVRLTIILPRFSAPGQYAIAVTRDQNGNGVVAQNIALAVSSGNKETVSLDLDLRKAKAGRYFLATTHEQDQAAYYYPLQIR
jgi:hypothetical protein